MLVGLMLAGCKLPSLEDMGNQPESMDATRVLIGQIQGSGDTSPRLGQDVIIEGIVVRNLMGDTDDMAQEVGETLGEGNRGQVVGWFVQDEGDGDPATSDALFVLDRGYDTPINMPAEVEYTWRLGSRVRTGDRIVVRGSVVELTPQMVADQSRSSGHPVALGEAGGTITAVAATSITLLEPGARAVPIMPPSTPPELAANENVEGMRLSRLGTGANEPLSGGM